MAGNIQKAAELPDSGNKSDLHNLVDNALIRSNTITNAMVNSSAAIASSKLADFDSHSDEDTLASNGTTWEVITNGTYFTINFIIDGGGETITTGIKGDIIVDVDATILGVTLLADQSCTMAVDIWKDTYANFPPDNDDSITDAGTTPTTSAGTKAQDGTMTSWTTTISAAEILRFNVDANDNATRMTVSIKCKRT